MGKTNKLMCFKKIMKIILSITIWNLDIRENYGILARREIICDKPINYNNLYKI